jgi:hypothetical protein
MTNPKIEKVKAEIEKAKAKISEYTAKLRSLERQKINLENEQIVALIRSERISDAEFAALMKSFNKNYNDDSEETETYIEEPAFAATKTKKQEVNLYEETEEDDD